MKFHFIGIGGIGMSGIAKVLLQRGYKITGSDIKYNDNIQELVKYGARIFIGHHEQNLSEDIDAVVVSSAINEDNVEYKKAIELGIAVYKRAEVLGLIMQDFDSIAIAGSHGKTTTTSMLYHILKNLYKNVGVIVGGRINGKNSNAILDNLDKYLVVEADESDASFLYLNPKNIVITNIDVDVNLSSQAFRSFDYDFKSLYNEMISLFKTFILKTKDKGWVIFNLDNKGCKALYPDLKDKLDIFTYSIQDDKANLKAKNIRYEGFYTYADIYLYDVFVDTLVLRLPGLHNIYNSLATLSSAYKLSIDLKEAIKVLSEFKGVKRRFEIIGISDDIMVVDDYAHNPTKVFSVIQAAKLSWPDSRVIAVFQPHRYTRTKLLFDKYLDSFEYADKVFITDIYSASEETIEGINSKTLTEFLKTKYLDKVEYSGSLSNTLDILKSYVKPKDIVLLLGAGDVNTIGQPLLDFFHKVREEVEVA